MYVLTEQFEEKHSIFLNKWDQNTVYEILNNAIALMPLVSFNYFYLSLTNDR